VGAIPHRFDEWGVDFAFWCGYKYLNAGPGSIAGLFVNRKHHGSVSPGLPGWWGFSKKRQFDMLPEFEPELGAGAWQIGTVSMLSAAPLEGSLRMFAEAGIDKVRAKSLALTEYLIYLAREVLAAAVEADVPEEAAVAGGAASPAAGAGRLEDPGFAIATPLEPRRRGGHVALSHPEAVRITAAMKAAGVIPDFRFPNLIRLAPVALYTSFHDVWKAVHLIRDIVGSGEHLKHPGERGPVA
jgi:kynureninase